MRFRTLVGITLIAVGTSVPSGNLPQRNPVRA